MGVVVPLVALALLNGALTMANIWPTPWVRPAAQVSPELIIVTLAMAAAVGFGGRLRARWRWGLSALLLILIGGRYAVVTTEGLFGRPVNLYWEAVRLPDVMALLLDSVPLWLVTVWVVLGAIALVVAILLIHGCVKSIATGLESPAVRRWVVPVCIVLLAGLVVTPGPLGDAALFARAVSPAYGRQVGLVFDHARHPRLTLEPAADTAVNWRPKRDVYIVFFESYGATVFGDPEHRAMLDGDYNKLALSLDGSGWKAVSAFVDSPTFGGASWLAHASLLSGRRIGDQRDYLTLIESGQPLLSHDFHDAGYRTIALVPGITRDWPEGTAFGYDKIYDAGAIDYDGPRFGWWEIPDQYSLAFLGRREIGIADRPPLFVLFPTVMSHMPFSPTPPYVTEWGEMGAVLGAANADAFLDDRRAAYVGAVRYNLATLGGFLRDVAADDAVVMVLGDHQPPALITGANVPWAVPVHIFAKDRQVLAGFEAAGFQPGVRPNGPGQGGIAALATLVREAAQAN